MTVGPDFRDITSAIIAIEAEARADEAEKWSAVFDDEKWGIRKARREAEARAESSAEMERLRAALQWFADNAPVEWDEDLSGCRYCGAFERTPNDHRKGCEYVKARAALGDSR